MPGARPRLAAGCRWRFAGDYWYYRAQQRRDNRIRPEGKRVKVTDFSLGQVVDLERYPIDDETAPLCAQVRDSLDHDGSCLLPGFVRAEALRRMAREAESLASQAYPGPAEATPYFFNYRLGEGQDLPATHPLRRVSPRRLAQVASDLIPAHHWLRQLYEHPAMSGFLARVLECPVYLSADRYQSLNVSVMEEGGCQQWHFDSNDMVTTLLLQEPEGGGVFEYAPDIRSESDEHFEEVERVLDGEAGLTRILDIRAGTLTLFRGHYSLHRVTPVVGRIRRMQAILGYTVKPELHGSFESSVLHYGPRVSAHV